MSYSEADRQRFIEWLKKKYGTIEELNRAWATQRWSRRLSRFEDVDLPLADGPGPSERYLDLHRYWSDVTVDRLRELDAIRQAVVVGIRVGRAVRLGKSGIVRQPAIVARGDRSDRDLA